MTMSPVVLAIDPGTEKSGYVLFDGTTITGHGTAANDDILTLIDAQCYDQIAVEMVSSYGQRVGREVFETVYWTGRFDERARLYRCPAERITRREIKNWICPNVSKSNDSAIRLSLIDMWGGKEEAVGRKAAPGPLYGIKSHAWAALAVAVTHLKQKGLL